MSVSISFVRRVAVLSALGIGLFFSGACGDNCIDGKQCTCTDSSCEDVCESETQGGCQFTCNGSDSCKNTCPGGGCQMTCDSGDCALDCAGGGCSLTCTGSASSCVITSCTSGCSLDCNGASTCQSSCDPLNGGCSTAP